MFTTVSPQLSRDASHRLRKNWWPVRGLQGIHWVVNSRTAKYHFGNSFFEAYEDPYERGIYRLQPIFKKAAVSLNTTIRPNAKSMELIAAARKELYERILEQDPSHDYVEDSYVGVHIRRGDQKATSWKFHNTYIPLKNYYEATRDSWDRLNGSPKVFAYIASDSPDALAKLQEMLPSKSTFSLAQSRSASLRDLVSPRDYFQAEFNASDEAARIAETRGMLVDFALLSGLWIAEEERDPTPLSVVCTISSSVCRLSAVGLGWENAFGDLNEMGDIDEDGKHWIEIDENGSVMPVWQAFKIF